MMIRSLFLAVLMATGGWASTTYSFTSGVYGTVTTTACAVSPCANYTTAMQITGSFTLAAALPANFSGVTDISSQVTAYSFSDGINTYTNTDPNARLYQFNVGTDASGNISVASILIEKWQSGTSPHSVGDRVALVNLNGFSINQGENDLRCITVGGGTGSGVADLCVTATSDGNSSTASATSGTWTGGGTGGGTGGTGTPAAVPTLGEWGMIFLTALLGVFAWMRLRRQQRVPPPTT